MNKKKDRIINAILFVVLILTIGIILFLTKSNVFKPKEEVPEVVIPNSGYEVFKVENLTNKMNKLSYSNKKQDFYNKSSKINVNTSISAGKVTVTLKIKGKKVVYDVDNIGKAIGVHTNAYGTTHYTYILTEEGKVYKIEDDLNVAKNTENYKGTAVDLGLTNVVKIAIDKNLKFKINNELKEIVPCVYVKTDDNRYFTDEKIIEGKNIVELEEKVIENTSQTN